MLYLLLFFLAESLASSTAVPWGLAIHALLPVVLLLHAAVSTGPTRNLFAVMAVLPFLRLLPSVMPLGLIGAASWFPSVAIPLLASVAVAVRVVNYRWSEIGLNLNNPSLQLMVGATGVLLGLIARQIVDPSPQPQTGVSGDVLWPLLSLLLFTGLPEELLFRGLLQRAAVEALGVVGGIAFGALLFATFHLFWYEPLGVGFVLAMGVYFGLAVHVTRSILGVTIAHTIVSLMIFLPLSL